MFSKSFHRQVAQRTTRSIAAKNAASRRVFHKFTDSSFQSSLSSSFKDSKKFLVVTRAQGNVENGDLFAWRPKGWGGTAILDGEGKHDPRCLCRRCRERRESTT